MPLFGKDSDLYQTYKLYQTWDILTTVAEKLVKFAKKLSLDGCANHAVSRKCFTLRNSIVTFAHPHISEDSLFRYNYHLRVSGVRKGDRLAWVEVPAVLPVNRERSAPHVLDERPARVEGHVPDVPVLLREGGVRPELTGSISNPTLIFHPNDQTV